MSFSLCGCYGSYPQAQEAIFQLHGAPLGIKAFLDDASRHAFQHGAASPNVKCVAVKLEARGHLVANEGSWGISECVLKVEPIFVKK